MPVNFNIFGNWIKFDLFITTFFANIFPLRSLVLINSFFTIHKVYLGIEMVYSFAIVNVIE